MKIKKSWIKKLDDNSLDYFFNKKNVIDKVPKYLDKKINNIFLNTEVKTKKDKIGQISNIFNFNKLIYTTSFILILLFSIITFYFIKKSNLFFNQKINTNSIIFTGDIKIIRNNSFFSLSNKKFIKKYDYINVENNSSINLKVGYNSEIIVNQNSLLKIVTLKKAKDKEINRLYLEKGKIECKVSLLSNNSIFEILTNTSLISVKGTHFFIEVLENKNINVKVIEGIVEISDFIKTTINPKKIRINKINKNELNKLLNQKILIKQKESILLNNIDLNNYNNKIDKLLLEINNAINKNEIDIIPNLIKTFKKFDQINQTENINYKEMKEENISENEDIVIEEDNKTEKEIIIEKLQYNPGFSLNEKNTAVTTDNKNIFISSDSNKAIICVNPENGRLKWIFNHPDLDKITSAAINYKNKIILANPDNIFILESNGKLKSITKIKNGPIYWPKNKKIKNNLYIPTSNTIYKYDGESLTTLNNFNDTMGQIYISSFSDNILCFNLNEKNIIIYNIPNQMITFTSNKIHNRAFMSPLSTPGDYIYIADSIANIYRFNITSNNRKPDITNIGIGVMSNLIYDNNHLYFIANDGYLNKLNLTTFKSSDKIIQVDKNPNSNKYLTKNMLKVQNYLFYAADTGNIFYYNLKNNKYDFLPLSKSFSNIPLIGSPVKINEKIYFIDIRSNIYKINKVQNIY